MAKCEGTRVAAGAGALARAIEAAKDGAVLCLEKGEYEGGVEIGRSIKLVGEGPGATVLKGTSRGPALHVEEDGLNITIEGLTISGGVAESGGGIAVRGRGRVEVRACELRDNKAGYYGGGAIFAKAGLLVVDDTVFEANQGNQGGALLLDGAMKAEFRHCRFKANSGTRGGAVRVREGVIAAFERCTFEGNKADGPGSVIHADGTTSRAPDVTISDCDVLDGTFDNSGGGQRAKVTVRGSRLPASFKGAEGLTDGGGNSYREEPR